LKPLKTYSMQTDIFKSEPLSRNIYVRRSQIISRIAKIRDITQNQKFTNEILYSFLVLRENLDYYKKLYSILEKEILLRENNTFIFGS